MSTLHEISGCKSASRKADVLFIHGLGGDPFTTWRHGKDESTSWPHWIGEEFPEVGVWSLGYAASPIKWAKLLRLVGMGNRDSGHALSLPVRAGQVLDQMVQKGIGERPLCLVGHSLGGLLAKQILRKASDAITDPRKAQVAGLTKGMLFLATPHQGATLASLAQAFRRVLGATASLQALQAHDDHLAELFDWYRNHSPRLHIQTRTYFETRKVKGVLPIVNASSAHPGIGADPVGLDEDHLSIAKPREKGAQVCDALRDLLRQHALAAPDAPVFDVPSAPPYTAAAPGPQVVVNLDSSLLRGAAPSPAPCEIPPAASRFFGRNTERQQLLDRLRAGLNTAVVGPAGLGKTALAAEALQEIVGARGERLAASPYPDGLVYLDLYTFRGELEPAWHTLAQRLRGAGFMEHHPARERAVEACRGRRLLVIVEGGEEADGQSPRGTIPDLFRVLSPENRWLLLTRDSKQARVPETVRLDQALQAQNAEALLASLTASRPLAPALQKAVLTLLEGHPLALQWAGNLLAREEEAPADLVQDWGRASLPPLRDPMQAEHTLGWLFQRSVRGLPGTSRMLLAAAGLLARAPLPEGALCGALEAETPAMRAALHPLVHRGLLRRAEADGWQFTHVLGYRFAREERGSDPALPERVGAWLHGDLAAALGCKDPVLDAARITPLLQHAEALLRADAYHRLWEPLGKALLYAMADRLVDLGRLDWVGEALAAVERWLEGLPAEAAGAPDWQHHRCALHARQGDWRLAMGDGAGALATYRASLEIAERLAKGDPSNVVWQRDLSVSHDLVGGVLEAQGDGAGALKAYRASLEIAERLAQGDPSNVVWQRDLSVSHNRVGGVLEVQGDGLGALKAYRASLEIAERLAQADPSNVVWQRDLSVSHNRVGGVLQAQGDGAGALKAYRASLEIRERLAQVDPSNAGWQRDLGVSHNKVGGVLEARGDRTGALKAYRASLEIRERLAQGDPSNAEWQRDLSVSHNLVGGVLQAQGDGAGALKAYRASLEIRERLAQGDPSNAGWQRDLSVSHNKVGGVLEDQGDGPGALAAYSASLEIRKRLAQADPSNAGWQRDLSVSQNLVGGVLQAQGDGAGALKAYRASLEIAERLAQGDPSNAGWQRGLSLCLTCLAQFHARQGEREAALRYAEASLGIDERLSALDPSHAVWRKDVAMSRALVERLRAIG